MDLAKLERDRKALLEKAARRALATESDEIAAEITREANAEAVRLAREIEAARAVEARGLDVEAAITKAVETVRLLGPTVSPEHEAARRERVRAYIQAIEVKPAPRGAPTPVELRLYTPKALAFLASRVGAHVQATL